VPILIGASLLLLLLSLDGRLGLLDGRMFFALLLAYTGFLIVQSRRETRAAQDAHAAPNDYEAELQPAAQGAWDSRLWVQLLLIVAGSDWLVTASVVFAKTLGVSDVVIGLTIVAAGTSMPEVATSLAAAFKGERDIAVGNAVGSSTLKILGCLGLSGLLAGSAGLTVPSSVLAFDIWVMLAVALASLPIFLSGREIARWEGGVFLAYYAAYVTYIIMSAQEHAALPTYSAVMMGFVIPLTVITLVVSLIRRSSPAKP